jgi:hypothetical protein
MEWTKSFTEEVLTSLLKLSGKKRFAKICTIYASNPNIEPKALEYEYLKSVWDVYEAMTFTDRLHNNGFYRHSSDAIERYMDRFITAMTQAKNHNLI